MEVIWENIVGYEGLYRVNCFGDVNSLNYRHEKVSKILKQHLVPKGYLNVTLCKEGGIKKFSIHRLVATAFISNPNNLPQVNHIDGNKQNNNVGNLEWCTPSENIRHAVKIGLIKITQETRNRMSFSHKGEKSYNYGRHFSEETKKRLSKSHKGIFDGDANPMYGKLHSEETKRKMSESKSNISEKTKKKLSNSHKGIKNPRCVKVTCLTTNENFDYILQASSKYGVSRQCISACCEGKQKTAGVHPTTKERLVWAYR